MLRAAVLPQDVLAGGLLTNLQSAAVLRQGFSGRIFSLKTQEQPDLQTVALGVLPGSGHPPRAARRPDRPHRKGPNQGPQGSHAPWNREFPAARRSPLMPRPRDRACGGRVCCGRAEDRDAAWGWGAPRGGGAGGGGRGRRPWPLSPFHRTLCPHCRPSMKGLWREPAGHRPAHAPPRSSEGGGVAGTGIGWASPRRKMGGAPARDGRGSGGRTGLGRSLAASSCSGCLSRGAGAPCPAGSRLLLRPVRFWSSAGRPPLRVRLSPTHQSL